MDTRTHIYPELCTHVHVCMHTHKASMHRRAPPHTGRCPYTYTHIPDVNRNTHIYTCALFADMRAYLQSHTCIHSVHVCTPAQTYIHIGIQAHTYPYTHVSSYTHLHLHTPKLHTEVSGCTLVIVMALAFILIRFSLYKDG